MATLGLVILDDVYDDAVAALRRAGAYLASAGEKAAIEETLWVKGRLNRRVIAKDAEVLRREMRLPEAAAGARFFLVEEDAIGRFADEKLSLVLTVYRARNLDHAIERVAEILEVKGKGHSCGIHTRRMENTHRVAEELDVVRVLVNFAHTFGNGGGFDSGLNFTLSMGCGTWQGNSISENLGVPALPQHHPLVHGHPRRQAGGRGALRRLLGALRQVSRGQCATAVSDADGRSGSNGSPAWTWATLRAAPAHPALARAPTPLHRESNRFGWRG